MFMWLSVYASDFTQNLVPNTKLDAVPFYSSQIVMKEFCSHNIITNADKIISLFFQKNLKQIF